jgi:hypothetical protein
VDEGGDVLESLKCDGVCDGGVWGVGMEAFPVVAIVANEVGDRAKDLVWYDGGHGAVRRRGRKPIALLWEEGSVRMVRTREGGSVRLVLEMVAVFSTGKSECLFLSDLWSFFSSCHFFLHVR